MGTSPFKENKSRLKHDLSRKLNGVSRGLELRINENRQKFRQLARCAILKAQNTIRQKETYSEHDQLIHLAGVASRFSRWAGEVALRTGKVDAMVASILCSEKNCKRKRNNESTEST